MYLKNEKRIEEDFVYEGDICFNQDRQIEGNLIIKKGGLRGRNLKVEGRLKVEEGDVILSGNLEAFEVEVGNYDNIKNLIAKNVLVKKKVFVSGRLEAKESIIVGDLDKFLLEGETECKIVCGKEVIAKNIKTDGGIWVREWIKCEALETYGDISTLGTIEAKRIWCEGDRVYAHAIRTKTIDAKGEVKCELFEPIGKGAIIYIDIGYGYPSIRNAQRQKN
jgi:hypothetical protein